MIPCVRVVIYPRWQHSVQEESFELIYQPSWYWIQRAVFRRRLGDDLCNLGFETARKSLRYIQEDLDLTVKIQRITDQFRIKTQSEKYRIDFCVFERSLIFKTDHPLIDISHKSAMFNCLNSLWLRASLLYYYFCVV